MFRRGPVALALLWASVFYFWILPLVRPHGPLGWGHYRFRDIFLGVPAAVAALCATAVLASPPERRRALTIRLTTLVLSGFIAAAGFDVGYTLLSMRFGSWLEGRGVSRAHNVPDPELGYVRKPRLSWRGRNPNETRLIDYRTDENGFRNALGIRSAAIVFLGDSFTEGAEVAEAETYPRLIAAQTGEEVVNLARSGYGPPQEAIVFRRYGIAYAPRAVVWQIYEGNDLADASRFARWRADPSVPLENEHTFTERYPVHSPIFRLLDSTVAVGQVKTAAPAEFLDRIGRTEDDPDTVDRYPEGYRETARSIEEVAAACRARGIRLLLLVIPAKVRATAPSLTPSLSPAARKRVAALVNDKSYFGYAAAVLCKRAGCDYVDALPALKREAYSAYLSNNPHLDVRGHEIVSRLVTGWLQKVMGK